MSLLINNFDIFLKTLKSIQKEDHYDFSNFWQFNFNLDQLSEIDLEKIAHLLKYIEANNLFIIDEKIANDHKVLIYEHFFKFITLNYIDYTTFFSDLNRKNLHHLKQAYFSLFEITNGRVFNDHYVQKIKTERKKFRNDHDSVVELLNLKMDIEFKKAYLKLNEIIIDPNYFDSIRLQKWHTKYFGKYNRNYQYKMTM